MKKNKFITLFIAAHILFIFLQVYKHTQFVKSTYEQQKHEKKHSDLKTKKQTLIQQLYALKDRNNIRKFAKKSLKMRPIRLNQVKNMRLMGPYDKQI